MRHIAQLLLLFLSTCCLACDITYLGEGDEQFKRCERLDDNYILYWKIEGQNDTIVFKIEIRNNAGGWVGLGMSPTGGMKGADIVIIEKVDGRYTISDRFAEIYGEPTKDDHGDVELLSDEERIAPSNTISTFVS